MSGTHDHATSHAVQLICNVAPVLCFSMSYMAPEVFCTIIRSVLFAHMRCVPTATAHVPQAAVSPRLYPLKILSHE